MICERCGGEGAFSIQQDGETTILCSLCLDKAFPDIRLGGLTRAMQRSKSVGTCPHCGWTSEKAKKTGLVGCPLCYESLDPAIWPDFGIHVVENVAV